MFHIFVRERGKFYFEHIFLKSNELTLENLEKAILREFEGKQYEPIWKSKRPEVLVRKNDLSLKIYHIYPYNVTQREALYGSSWFRSDIQFREHLRSNPCPKLEVIFV